MKMIIAGDIWVRNFEAKHPLISLLFEQKKCYTIP